MSNKTVRSLILFCVVTMLTTTLAACGKESPSGGDSQTGESGFATTDVAGVGQTTVPTTDADPEGPSIVTGGDTVGGTTVAQGTSTASDSAGAGTTTKPPVTQNPADTAITRKDYQNMRFSSGNIATAYSADKYTVQNLGLMQMDDYPIDGVYDQAFNVIKVGDTYKMWWCRACPHDTVWYAESKDLKNWTNYQCVIDMLGYSSTWAKAMLSWPSVLYVNGKYHMFFESPAELGASGEYSNNIFYATSPNGIDWTFFPNNKDPQPVIKNPNVREGVYGVGQPKAFYKDGYFYVVYTDASTNGGDIRVARSKGNGYSFEGTVASHTKILANVAGAAVRYNSTTGKYYLTVTASETQSNGVYNDNIYMMESDDLYNWPYPTRARLLTYGTRLSVISNVTKKANADFVTDGNGIVTSGETMYFVYMDGVLPSADVDHRVTHTTWDGKLMVVLPKTVANNYTLPNGKASTAANLKAYADRVATWVRPSVNAVKNSPKVDGTKDAAYGNEAKIATVIYNTYDCKPTKTTGTASFAWDNEALYVHLTVKDSRVVTGLKTEKAAELWRDDSVSLFIDVPNTQTGTNGKVELTASTYRVTINASGKYVVVDGLGNDITSKLGKATVSVKTVAGGYVIEAKLPWYDVVKNQIKGGKTIGLDIQINDNFGTAGDREAQVFWSDYTGESTTYLDRFGELKLK